MSRPSDTRSDAGRLAAILDSTIEGVYSNDLQGRCTFINQAAARMLGYTPEEVVGKSMHELIHHSHPDSSPYPLQECSMFQACRTGQVNRSDDEVFWRRDGTPVAVEYSSSPIREQGEIQGAVVTFFDITKRKQAVRRLTVQHAVSSVLAEAASFAEAAPRLLQDIGEALEWQAGAVWRVDWQANVLRCTATWHAPSFPSGEFEAATRRLTLRPAAAFPAESGRAASRFGATTSFRSPICPAPPLRPGKGCTVRCASRSGSVARSSASSSSSAASWNCRKRR